MTQFNTVNPKNGKTIRSYEFVTDQGLTDALDQSKTAYQHWRRLSFEERGEPAKRLAQLFQVEAPRLAAVATDEMGKPLAQAVKEVEKCATACLYYATQAAFAQIGRAHV